ncbi:MAG: YbgC/FadM family acyl-CoA thioesterase [bacterium]|nr:YbgC/FadM family acyl-CoA thioesterase [bacterium]
MELRIYYSDTDCGGVVYYANYLKYLEMARTEHLRSRGINIAELAEDGCLFVVSKAEVNYKFPAVYNDTVSIETEIVSVGNASFNIAYRILRKSDSKLLVDAKTKMVSVGCDRIPVRLTRDLKEKLQSLVKA